MNLHTLHKERLTGMTALGIVSLLLFMTVGLAARAAEGENDLFYDGFETGTTSSWTSNDGWDVVDEDASEGEYMARASEATSSQRDTLTKLISTEGYEDIELMFDYKTTNLEDDDRLRVQVNMDGSWETVYRFDEDDEATDWTSKTIALSSDADDNDAFGFRLVSDLAGEEDEFHLDEVHLRGTDIDDTNGNDGDTNDDLRDVIEHIRYSFEDNGSDIEIHMDLDATTRDGIIMTLADLLNLSEDEIDDLLRNETDDDDDNGSEDGDEDNDEDNGNGDNGDNSGELSDLQAIYVYIWSDSAGVELDYDYTFEWLSFDTTDRDEIIERTADYLDADEDDVEELMVFSTEDKDDGKDDDEDGKDDDDNGDKDQDDGKDDDDPVTEGVGVEDLQAIYVYVWSNSTSVELDFDYTFEWLSFDTTDEEEILERIAEYLDADEDDVEELMVFEN